MSLRHRPRLVSAPETRRSPHRIRVGIAGAIALALVVGATIVGADAKAATTTTGASTTLALPTFAHTKTESFAVAGWWKTWSLTTVPWHTNVVTEGTDRFLRVNFPAGSHNGTSFDLPTGTADAAHLQYRI